MDNAHLSVPQKIDWLILKICSIEKLLTQDITVKLAAQTLSLDIAIEFLAKEGYPMSKSAIYKHTSNNTMPCKRFGGKLVFDRDELLQWCKSKTSNNNSEAEVINKLISSANKK